MKPIALTTTETWDYVLESNREDAPSDQVVFKLGVLSINERALVMDTISIGEDASVSIAIGSRMLLALRHGLRGFQGLQDASGSAIKFQKTGKVASDDSISCLRDEWITELGQEIINRSSLGGDGDEEDALDTEEAVGK